jgi:hypothetical protein
MGQRLDSGGKGKVRVPFLCHETLFCEKRVMGVFIRRGGSMQSAGVCSAALRLEENGNKLP